MLKNIKLKNFATFVEPTTIDFSATNYKFLESENVGSNRILKGCIFVGENASGKTKILEAIKLLLNLTLYDGKVNFAKYKSFYSKSNSYELEYTFMIENNEIIYNMVISTQKIEEEKLFLNGKNILTRLGSNAKFGLDEEIKFTDVSEDILFLRRIYFNTKFNDNKILNNWFDYLKNSVYINCDSKRIASYDNRSLLVHNCIDEKLAKEINEFFKKINYPNKISFVKNSNDNSEYKNLIFFQKNGTNVNISDTYESLGNQTLIEILPAFMHAIKNRGMLIVDEFSSGLHNELEECLIKYFFHYAKDSQLFLITHSTNVLNTTIIRPDQVYSLYFDKTTKIKRFSDEMPRESQNLEKMYLSGVFDGMPKYNKVFKD